MVAETIRTFDQAIIEDSDLQKWLLLKDTVPLATREELKNVHSFKLDEMKRN